MILVCFLAGVPSLFASNPIQIENAKPGTTDWQFFSEARSGEIEGYASATSVKAGDQLSLYVSTLDSSYSIEIYRMGWYGGMGARLVQGPVFRTGFKQAAPTTDSATNMVECHWTDPYTFTIPSDWTTGFYLAKLSAPSYNKQRYIAWVVRDDASNANHYYQWGVTTAQAYNFWGGHSLYPDNKNGYTQGQKVSFNRPYLDGSGTGTFLWQWDYNMVRFLEREGFDVAYCTDLDTARRGNLILNHKTFLSVGHDEYWSWEMRQNVLNAMAAGVNAAFFAANTAYWQIRFENNDRTITGYKETALTADPYATDKDATNDKYITTKWRDQPVNLPEAAWQGVQYIYNPVTNGDIVITNASHWVFANTGATNTTKLHGLLGYEVDAMTSASPSNTVTLAHSPFTNTSVTPNRTDYSDMTFYTASSGANVFAAGTIQWSWGLDNWNATDHGGDFTNPIAQQMTRNILFRFAGGTASRDCQYTLAPASATVTATAGGGAIQLTTPVNCSWSASTNQAWVTVTPANGAGSATISYTYTQNSGAARVAPITIGDKTFNLTQQGCSYRVSPTAQSFTAGGGQSSINIDSDGGCTWSASTTTPWITLSGPTSGSGTGAVAYGVASNSGPARNGSIIVAGTTVAISQASGCSYSVAPTSASFSAAGANGTIHVTTTSSDCPWTASGAPSWITFPSGTSFAGSGDVTYSVAPNTGTARTGTFVVAGQTITVRQSDGCTYSVTPSSASFPIGGGNGSLTVNASSPSCFWSASSYVPWVTITAPQGDGQGSGSVQYTVAANNNSSARSTRLGIAGQSVDISQDGVPCAYSIQPAGATVGPEGDARIVTITATNGCYWGTTDNVPWITIDAPAEGRDSGRVTVRIQPNTTGSPRSGTIAIAGNSFTVYQCAGNCPALTWTNTTTAEDGLRFTGTVTNGAPIASVTWQTSGSTSAPKGTASGTANWSIGPVVFAAGQSQLIVTAVDTNGVKGEIAVPVIIGAWTPGVAAGDERKRSARP